MKFFKLLTGVIGITAITFSACKKDSPEPTPSMLGFWAGKYGVANDYPSSGYAFLFQGKTLIGRIFFVFALA